MTEQSRQKQLDSTKLLSMFLEAEDLRSTVQKHVDMLQEDFFIISSTYMEMVLMPTTVSHCSVVHCSPFLPCAAKHSRGRSAGG